MPDPYYRDNDSDWNEFLEWWDSWSLFGETEIPPELEEKLEGWNKPPHIGELFGMDDPPYKSVGKYLDKKLMYFGLAFIIFYTKPWK